MPMIDQAIFPPLAPSQKGHAKGKVALPQASERKTNGIHYTPPSLAAFLAKQVIGSLPKQVATEGPLSVLDPACGDGELLEAISAAAPPALRVRLRLTGFDTDANALQRAQEKLLHCGVAAVDLRCLDFLSAFFLADAEPQMGFEFAPETSRRAPGQPQFDAIISNPPYVRTQVLGAAAAQELATRFKLTGRVDLYHAFVKAMTVALREGGVLGLLTSNRFLSVQSGHSMRAWLASQFRMLRLVDLGDTKLFEAAVLPAVLVALRKAGSLEQDCEFIRVYEASPQHGVPRREVNSVLDALDGSFTGYASTGGLSFHVQTGRLLTSEDNAQPWMMSNRRIDSWLATVKAHAGGDFADVAKVCVGIKTTADEVFVRDDWEALPEADRPEEQLLHPLVTHHVATRWRLPKTPAPAKRVLYPYWLESMTRVPVDLANYPRARRYLLNHRQRLEARNYVIESGRQWYEIWVPQRPADWSVPKIAFPDISETSKFFLVEPGWIVNGDCYWMKLHPGKEAVWLNLMLAVANSAFIHKFYDLVFHNKLYAGRRRFMSQYVNRFPLPKLEIAGDILDLMPLILHTSSSQNAAKLASLQSQLDDLVWEAFGLAEEVAR